MLAMELAKQRGDSKLRYRTREEVVDWTDMGFLGSIRDYGQWRRTFLAASRITGAGIALPTWRLEICFVYIVTRLFSKPQQQIASSCQLGIHDNLHNLAAAEPLEGSVHGCSN